MKPAIKASWIRALRSGRYKQGHGALAVQDGKSWCCLGVLCNLPSVPGEWTNDVDGDGDGYYKFGGKPFAGKISGKLLKWLGIKPKEQDHLIEMNDTHENDFDEIADWIKENL